MPATTGAQDTAMKVIARDGFVTTHSLSKESGQTINAAGQTIHKLKGKGVLKVGPDKSLDAHGYRNLAQYVLAKKSVRDPEKQREYNRNYYKRKQAKGRRGDRINQGFAQNEAIAQAATILKANEWPIDQFLTWVDITKGIMDHNA